MRKVRFVGEVLVVVFVMVFAQACAGGDSPDNCIDTFAGPSCVKGKAGSNNLPHGPGPGVRAVPLDDWGIYDGDRKLEPNADGVYMLKTHMQEYRLKACVQYTVVPGRRLTLRGEVVTTFKPIDFEESNPAYSSPVCLDLPFNMAIPGGVTNTATAKIVLSEGGQDLSFSEPTQKSETYPLRVSGT